MDARKWIEHESGLLIPERIRQSTMVAKPGGSRRSKTNWISTLTALASVVISIGSLAIATEALWTQDESFADQVRNRESSNASRVTWWRDSSGAFKVQNASSVRIENVYLRYLKKDGKFRFIDLPDMDPCTITSVSQNDEVLMSAGFHDEPEFSLSFFDRVAAWNRPPYGNVRLAIESDFPSWHLNAPEGTETRTSDRLDNCTIGD